MIIAIQCKWFIIEMIKRVTYDINMRRIMSSNDNTKGPTLLVWRLLTSSGPAQQSFCQNVQMSFGLKFKWTNYCGQHSPALFLFWPFCRRDSGQGSRPPCLDSRRSHHRAPCRQYSETCRVCQVEGRRTSPCGLETADILKTTQLGEESRLSRSIKILCYNSNQYKILQVRDGKVWWCGNMNGRSRKASSSIMGRRIDSK